MKLSPSYQLSILSEEAFPEQMDGICEQLAQCRQTGTFSGCDGKSLYYEAFFAENSRGAVVVVHGLSEFLCKYYEFTWYMLNQGYDVFLYDQRCHGRSCRLTDRNDMIHVDRFSDYCEDLECFIRCVVKKTTELPLYLYGYSMGGATAALYLAQHPDTFQKAVLAAPMIEPLTGGVPPLIARVGLGTYALFGGGKKKFWMSGEFDPEYPFSRSQDRSLARFTRNMQLRLENPCFCTTPQTVRWVHQSLIVRKKLTKKAFVSKIRTPVLMLCAEKDTVVCEKAQQEFAEKCPVCCRKVIPGATHSMLCGTQAVITEHMQQLLAHFG